VFLATPYCPAEYEEKRDGWITAIRIVKAELDNEDAWSPYDTCARHDRCLTPIPGRQASGYQPKLICTSSSMPWYQS
jgi:hypothetical protein